MESRSVSFESFDRLAKQSCILPERLCLPDQHVSWRIGRESYRLPFSEAFQKQFFSLGTLCGKYHDAIEALFLSDEDFRKRVNIYRGEAFLDNCHNAASLSTGHIFYRPDLVLTEDSRFKMAEIDALPGELGVHCFLLAAYGIALDGILDSFKNVLEELQLSQTIDFVIDPIASEDEYTAEYKYLADRLNTVGIKMNIYNIQEYRGPKAERTLVYRFFDMVRNDQSRVHDIIDRIRATESYLYPPIKHYLEEKLSLSYVHDKNVENIFLRYFTEDELSLFRSLLPRVHYLNKNARSIQPPLLINGTSVDSFSSLVAHAPHIPYVLKTSAFSDQFSTSKGAILLEGLSKEQLARLIEERIYKFDENFILQEKIQSQTIEVETLDSDSTERTLKGFSRLTPFYFKRGKRYALASSHIVIRENKFDVHFASDSTVIPAIL